MKYAINIILHICNLGCAREELKYKIENIIIKFHRNIKNSIL